MEQRITWDKVKLCSKRSALVGLFLLVAFSFPALLNEGLLVASLGSSAFAAFHFPRDVGASFHRMIGGYAVGSFYGVGFALLRLQVIARGGDRALGFFLFCALAIFLCSLTMTLLDVEYPTGCALTVALVLSEQPIPMGIAAMVSIFLLYFSKSLLIYYSDRKHGPPGTAIGGDHLGNVPDHHPYRRRFSDGGMTDDEDGLTARRL